MTAITSFRPRWRGELLAAQRQVLYAIMLRDIRARFFGSALGFLVMAGWPLSHIIILLVINTALGRAAPYGESQALFIATGVVPFMVFSYVSRFTMLGMITNKPLLLLPIINVNDILFARVILEILSSVIVIIVLAIAFWGFGIDFTPAYTIEAFKAFGAAVLLGVGFGICGGIITAFVPMAFTIYSLSTIVLWVLSGVLVIPDALPEQAQYWLSFNPSLQCVEWMRSAYYDGYGAHILDKTYLIRWGVATVLVGLVLERLMRGKILAG
jgi:capsular polysaccharide transport system permease protein